VGTLNIIVPPENGNGKMKTDLRARFVEEPLRPLARLRIYLRGVRDALISPPPKTYTRTELVHPGEEGYEDCSFAVDHVSGTGPFVQLKEQL